MTLSRPFMAGYENNPPLIVAVTDWMIDRYFGNFPNS